MQPVEYGNPDEPRYVRPAQPVQPVEPVEPVRPVRPVDRDYADAPSWRGWRAAQIVYTIFGIIEVLILIRIILKLLAANPDAGFSSLIYGITGPLVAPFQGVFGAPSGNGSVLEISSILAIVVYALIAWGIARIIELSTRRRTPYTA
jgi:uncharacterized protein YggT (Ycf19 family)